MGREIRKVPKNWEHPRDEYGDYKPMFNEAYIDVLNKWWENHLLWTNGEHPDQKENPGATKDCQYYSQWADNPPDVNTYNLQKWSEEETVCFQIYETVTEGTPVSPVFDNLKDVENWLVKIHNITREAAEQFCSAGWWPSLIAR